MSPMNRAGYDWVPAYSMVQKVSSDAVDEFLE